MRISKRGEFSLYLYDSYKKRFTGTITITTKNNTHIMHLLNGKPTFIKEEKTTMPLGRVFVELGMIDNRAYDESLMEMAKTGGRQGEILLKKGLITVEQMKQAISVQFYKKALKFFEISDGEIKIEEKSEILQNDTEGIKNISTIKILYNGIKSLNKEHINKLLPITSNTVVTRKDELDITLFSLPINAEETTLIENIRSKTPITHLIQLRIASETEIAQIIYFLFVNELIEVSTLDFSETSQSDENYVKLSGIYKPTDSEITENKKEESTNEKTTIAPVSTIEDIKWINDLYEKFQTMDYFEFFGTERNAAEQEINSAYQKMLKRLNTVKNDANIDEDLSVKIDQLAYFAEEAYNTLISEKSRKEYNSIISSYFSKSPQDEGMAELEFTKGEIYLTKRNFSDAYESFKKAIELGGQKPEYLAAYGISLYLNLNEAQRSRETLGKLYIKRAISQNPRYINAHIYYMLITCIEGNSKEIQNMVNNIRNLFLTNEKIKNIIAKIEKIYNKKPFTGEISQALREGKKDNRLENLFNIFFAKN